MVKARDKPSPSSEYYRWAVPARANIPQDPLLLRLDFHKQAVIMHIYHGDRVEVKPVSALDVAHTLASELNYSSGFLPKDALWWSNGSRGPEVAIWVKPGIRKLALQEAALEPARRFEIPLPGLVFLCRPKEPPSVYAAKRRPGKLADTLYRAPFPNVFSDGRSCSGNHKYPDNTGDIPESFLLSFFSRHGDMRGRSLLFPDSAVSLWEYLDGKTEYPLSDLVEQCTVEKLMKGGVYAT